VHVNARLHASRWQRLCSRSPRAGAGAAPAAPSCAVRVRHWSAAGQGAAAPGPRPLQGAAPARSEQDISRCAHARSTSARRRLKRK